VEEEEEKQNRKRRRKKKAYKKRQVQSWWALHSCPLQVTSCLGKSICTVTDLFGPGQK
jgi:hypothetical protein